MTALLLFTGVNFILVQTITPVYDFVCFLPYWERRVSILYLIIFHVFLLFILLQIPLIDISCIFFWFFSLLFLML
ncbi:hypothetical protein GIB67_013502 [Kingdonia uniflora]|uniref:Uncharacterized protein n=1 Tax=Kingdonia uniflora TaxID=39325 RepID=A0A7J7M1G4_9MAGN|nr:hypothetical protein GIB67_013502 [Kingdonia uniflora]